MSSKLVLRKYHEFKSEINCVSFSPSGRFFAVCANETSWRLFDIQKGDESLLVYQKAHSDHIKKVLLMDDFAITGSQDRTLKKWSVSEPELIKTLKLSEPVETFCSIPANRLAVGNGNQIAIVNHSLELL